jgi:hypothetical protein
MRTISYFLCISFVASSVLCGIASGLLVLYGVSFPTRSFLGAINAFGFLAPRLASLFLSPVALVVLESAAVFLLLRRTWLLVVKKERVPCSFRGLAKGFSYLGNGSILLSLPLLLSSRGDGYFVGGLFGVLLLLSVLFTFGSFLLAEVSSFRYYSHRHET